MKVFLLLLDGLIKVICLFFLILSEKFLYVVLDWFWYLNVILLKMILLWFGINGVVWVILLILGVICENLIILFILFIECCSCCKLLLRICKYLFMIKKLVKINVMFFVEVVLLDYC